MSSSEASTKKVNTVKVVGVSLDTQEDVYNMTVDDNHNFSVNGGIITHNCDAMRYMVKTKRLTKVSTEYHSVFGR